MKRRHLIAGNWKMNGSLATNAVLLAEITVGLEEIARENADNAAGAAVDVAVCVPAPYFGQVQASLQGDAVKHRMALGGQDVSVHTEGAYTGEISVLMLADFGCTYVIVGHSERRSLHGETDADVAQKTRSVLRYRSTLTGSAVAITPIICVGETLAERESNQTEAVVGRQLAAVLEVLVPSDLAHIVVAYEPVWAIGTGKTATPEMAQQVHAFLRAQLAAVDATLAKGVQLLYGGSMKPDNALELLAMEDIDGGLIGGAALKSADFLRIVRAAQR